MRFTVGRLLFLVAAEAGLARLALWTHRCDSLGEFIGSWWALNLFCLLPSIIWYLRSRSLDQVQ